MNRRQFAGSVIVAAATQIGSAARAVELLSSHVSAPLKLSVMLWTILPHEPFERRIEIVAEAGYKSVELVHEIEKWKPADYTRFRKTRESLGISVDAICVAHFGINNPAESAGFTEELHERIDSAEALDCRDIIVLSGVRVPNISAAAQRQASIDMLKRAGDVAGKRGCRLLLESLDPEEAPDWFLNSVTEGFDIVREVGNPQVRMLYDFYHEQISAGNLTKTLVDNFNLLGLVHIADVPGRHEPGTGEINYRTILQRLAQLRYAGSIAMEFLPTTDPVQSLRGAREYAEAAFTSALT